jgi:hypothetical protein
MISEKEIENKIIRYANLNQYTILANTFGFIEYVKYSYESSKLLEHLKWYKGSNSITITKDGNSKKINIDSLD